MASLSLTASFMQLLQRDLLLALRRRSELVSPLVFFVLVISLFTLGSGASATTLGMIAPGIFWVAALLAVLLGLEGIFRADFSDGSLEQLLLSGMPLSVLVLAKVTAHWLVTGLPLLLLAPLLSLMLRMHNDVVWVLMATLLLGTPVLSLVGAIGVALTVGLRQGGVLLAVLVLPLYAPILIFATQAVGFAADGLPVTAHLAILGACLAAALTLAPFAISAALRVGIN